MSFSKEIEQRVALTTSLNDTDFIPKVRNAGQVLDDFEGYKVQVMHNGMLVHYGGYHGHWMAEIIKNLRGHHEPQEEKVFHEVLKHVSDGGVMIELGSYWAYYSGWFNMQIKNAKNYMIEPIAEKLEIGRRNFQLNNLEGEFLNAFIGSSSAEKQTFIDWDGSQRVLNRIAIDDFIRMKNIERVSIVHSDIQGAEVDMLLGASRSIKSQCIDFFVISTHGNAHEKCRKLLLKQGYCMIAEHTPKESASADGLLVMHASYLGEIPPVEISVVENRQESRISSLISALKRRMRVTRR